MLGRSGMDLEPATTTVGAAGVACHDRADTVVTYCDTTRWSVTDDVT